MEKLTLRRHMLNLNSIMIGTDNSKALAEFYEKLIGKKPEMAEGEWYGFLMGSCFLSIGTHDKIKGKSTKPERIIFNFETEDVKAEFERIKGIGATVIAEPYQMGEGEKAAWIATLADPDGNYFQLMTPWDGEK
jgi:predicted enzyme related to lactoylglutathione lyase